MVLAYRDDGSISDHCDECRPGSFRVWRFAGNYHPSTPPSQTRYDGGPVSDYTQHVADRGDDAT